MKKSVCIFILVAIIINNCSTLSTFHTNPPNAKIYINNNPIGNSPVTYSLDNLIFNNYAVRIEKEGYNSYYTSLDKEIKVLPLLGGIFLFWPCLLWCYGPKSEYYYSLTPITSDSE